MAKAPHKIVQSISQKLNSTQSLYTHTVRPYRRGLIASVSTAAVGGCGLYLYNWKRRKDKINQEMGDQVLRETAAAWSVDVLGQTIRDDDVLHGIIDILVKSFVDDEAKAALKSVLKERFTQDEETVGDLKQFIVRDVVQDPWVAETLIDMSKELGKSLIADEDVYPKASLDVLAECALVGIKDQRFINNAIAAAKDSLRYTLKG